MSKIIFLYEFFSRLKTNRSQHVENGRLLEFPRVGCVFFSCPIGRILCSSSRANLVFVQHQVYLVFAQHRANLDIVQHRANLAFIQYRTNLDFVQHQMYLFFVPYRAYLIFVQNRANRNYELTKVRIDSILQKKASTHHVKTDCFHVVRETTKRIYIASHDVTISNAVKIFENAKSKLSYGIREASRTMTCFFLTALTFLIVYSPFF